MTEEFFASVGNRHATQLHVYAANRVWFVDAVLDDSSEALDGPTVVTIGSLRLHCTPEPGSSGDFVLTRSMRLVAGAGGWGRLCEPRPYHDDAGVDAESVARDAAAEAGETLVQFDPAEPTLESDFVRGAIEASAVLEQVAGPGRVWWLDADGKTHVGIRPTAEAPAGSYDLLTYSPLTRVAVLSVDDPAALWVGSVLTDRLAEPQVIREIEIHVEVKDGVPSCRVIAWTGGDDSTSSRLGDSLDALLEQRESKRLYGTYRYRVVAVDSDSRLQLQAMRPLPGLPDVLPVSQVAGVASAISNPDLGTVVRVAFDEGDCQMPYVAGWPAGDPSKTAGIARMGDLTTSGGVSCTIMFGMPAAGGAELPPTPGAVGVPTILPNVPYLVSFGDALVPPTPPSLSEQTGDPLLGYVLTASDKGAIE